MSGHLSHGYGALSQKDCRSRIKWMVSSGWVVLGAVPGELPGDIDVRLRRSISFPIVFRAPRIRFGFVDVHPHLNWASGLSVGRPMLSKDSAAPSL